MIKITWIFPVSMRAGKMSKTQNPCIVCGDIKPTSESVTYFEHDIEVVSSFCCYSCMRKYWKAFAETFPDEFPDGIHGFAVPPAEPCT